MCTYLHNHNNVCITCTVTYHRYKVTARTDNNIIWYIYFNRSSAVGKTTTSAAAAVTAGYYNIIIYTHVCVRVLCNERLTKTRVREYTILYFVDFTMTRRLIRIGVKRYHNTRFVYYYVQRYAEMTSKARHECSVVYYDEERFSQPCRYHIYWFAMWHLRCAVVARGIWYKLYYNVLCSSIRNKYIMLLYSKYHGNKLHGVRIRFPEACLKFRFLRRCLAGDKSQSLLQSPGWQHSFEWVYMYIFIYRSFAML